MKIWICVIAALAAFARSEAKNVVAVFEFTNPSNQITALSSYLSDEVSIGLSKDSGYEMVERGQLQRVIAEQGLQSSGAFDDKTISRIGQLCGASMVVLGKYYMLGDSYEVVYRVVDVQTAKVSAINKKVFTKTESLAKLDAIAISNPPLKAPTGAGTSGLPEKQSTNLDTAYVIGPLTVNKCVPHRYVVTNGKAHFDCIGTAFSNADGALEFDRSNSYFYFNNGSKGGIDEYIYISNIPKAPIVSGVTHSLKFSIYANDEVGLASVQKSNIVLIFNGVRYESKKHLPINFQ